MTVVKFLCLKYVHCISNFYMNYGKYFVNVLLICKLVVNFYGGRDLFIFEGCSDNCIK